MADKYMGYEDLPPMPVCTFSAKEVSKTGAWRAQRPKFIKEKCIKCYICWKFCPEPSISIAKDGYIEIDYDFCKGCGICAKECPKDAIEMERERGQ